MTTLIKTALAAAVSATALIAPAYAADVEFTGVIGADANTCTLGVATPGTLTANGDFTELTTATLANEGKITATTTSPRFTISVAPPSAWNTGTAYTGTTTFATKFDLSSDNKGYLSGDQKLATGVTNASIQLTAKADKQNGEFFTPGAYSATVVVTCEAL